MESEQLFPAVDAPPAADVTGDLWLLQCYEPVLRFTRGELFLPMAVEDYLEKCSLWRSAGVRRSWGRRRPGERLCAPGELTPARLAEVSAPLRDNLSLRFVQRSLGWREFRAWRHDASRPRLATGSSRLAAVGLLGRLIDAVMRLSLLLRGRVPGGTAAAAERSSRMALTAEPTAHELTSANASRASTMCWPTALGSNRGTKRCAPAPLPRTAALMARRRRPQGPWRRGCARGA